MQLPDTSVAGAAGAAVFTGQAEVDAAADEFGKYLARGGASAESVSSFSRELARLLANKYATHWFPDQPSKGEGFRHLSCGRFGVDAAIKQALNVAGIPLAMLVSSTPRNLSVWCDPGQITTRIGNGELLAVKVDASGRGQPGRWTPPVSPQMLSASAPEFKPSPPNSPPVSLASANRRRLGSSGGSPQSRPTAPPGLSPQGGGGNPHTFSSPEVMSPPFAHFGVEHSSSTGFYNRPHHSGPFHGQLF
jgi:protein Tob/BTG